MGLHAIKFKVRAAFAMIVWWLAVTQSQAQAPVKIECKGMVGGIAFTPDGCRIVTGGEQLRLWDVAARKEIRTFRGSKDGELITGHLDGGVRFWDGPKLLQRAVLLSRRQPLSALAVSAD